MNDMKLSISKYRAWSNHNDYHEEMVPMRDKFHELRDNFYDDKPGSIELYQRFSIELDIQVNACLDEEGINYDES